MSEGAKTFEMEWGGRPLSFQVGKFAKQANGSVMVRYGDTTVLSTVTASDEAKDLPFFPLTVNYEERLYAVGKIPGGFLKREGRPGEKAVLNSRLIDRPLRPLFPDGFRNEVQVINTVMSVDQDCSPAITAMIGSSLALMISDIPFNGPIAGVTIGQIDERFIVNPRQEEMDKSTIDLTVAGTRQGVNMVEAGAREVKEERMLEAILFAHEEIKKLVDFQEEIARQVGKEKMDVELKQVNEETAQWVKSHVKDKLVQAIQTTEKHAREEAIEQAKAETVNDFQVQFEAEAKLENEEISAKIDEIKDILDDIVKAEVRRMITKEKIRPDGRSPEEIRPLTSEVGLLPRTHGSAMFTRGQTQALSVCTLGALGDVQIIDDVGVEESKRFMHHYNFPAFSVGEARPIRPPGRREIGHGALGERALEMVVPSEEDFPYTIRLVSEVLESNGSTSQASICASTMALMHAGVPIKAPVAGIAMGLVKEGEDVSILTDIQGMEDALGDMDFKVAGTKDGVTALQMDIKIEELNHEILSEALEQARKGRMQILENMLEAIAEPAKDLSPYAPKIQTMHIDPEKIRSVIGPSGKIINQIIEDTGVKIDIEQDGRIYISSSDMDMINKAQKMVENIVKDVKPGETYLGTVKRIEKFGAFIEVLPGKEGLCHISQLAEERVNKVEDILSMGDEVLVKVTEIDDQGRINLSRKALLKERKKGEAAKKK